MNNKNQFSGYSQSNASTYRPRQTSFKAPPPSRGMNWAVLILVSTIALGLFLRFGVNKDWYFQFVNTVTAIVYNNFYLFVGLFVVLGIISAISIVKYEQLDHQISTAVNPNHGHEINLFSLLGYLFVGICTPNTYIASKHDGSQAFRRGLVIRTMTAIKVICPTIAILLLMPAALYMIIPEWLTLDMLKELDSSEILDKLYSSDMAEWAVDFTNFHATIWVCFLLYFMPTLDILFYGIVRMLPFSESWQETVRYKITTRDGYGHVVSTRYEDRLETFSTAPIMLLIAVVMYGVMTAFYIFSSGSGLARIKNAGRVKRCFRRHPEIEDVVDYYATMER